MFDDDTLDAQVLSPDLRDELGVMAALDVDPARPRDPGTGARYRDRAGRRPTRARRHRTPRCGQDYRSTLQQVAGPQGKAAGAAMTIFELDATVFHPDHSTDVAALHVLDDQAHLRRVLCRAGLAPT